MNKANQATGATKSPTPNEFKAKGVAHRKAPSVLTTVILVTVTRSRSMYG